VVNEGISLSVIVPVLDEAARLQTLLPVLVQEDVQVLVVDGGSGDESVAVAGSVPGVQVVIGATPRARQMNLGAAQARGRALMFLHADTLPPPGFAGLIQQALDDAAVVGGAFSLALDDARLRARLVSRGANVRTRLTGHPYGDQAIFVRRDLFHEMGGFRPWPFLEDLDFARRLKGRGRLHLLPQAVTVSARRWRAQGYLRTTWRNTVLATWFYLGLDAARFERWLAPHREG
jgi:rSAM/selenodomain-associated transferase 2